MVNLIIKRCHSQNSNRWFYCIEQDFCVGSTFLLSSTMSRKWRKHMRHKSIDEHSNITTYFFTFRKQFQAVLSLTSCWGRLFSEFVFCHSSLAPIRLISSCSQSLQTAAQNCRVVVR